MNENAVVSFSGDQMYVDNCYIPYPNYYPWYEQHYHHYFLPSYPCIPEKSKTEQAFKIVGKLIDKKIVKELTVKDFLVLVNDVADIL